jgi:fatty acid desaturase
MASPDDSRNTPVFNGLHPAIYKALAALALWFVIAAWIFFGAKGYYAAFSAAVVTGFFVIAAAIPYVIWRTWRAHAQPEEPDLSHTSFSDWWRGQVETRQGRVEGWDAAIEVLMPLGTAAIGMTLIGLIFRLTAGS